MSITLPMYQALCAEVEALRSDAKWLACALADARKQSIDAMNKVEDLMVEKDRLQATLKHYEMFEFKTKGQVEADKLASLVGELDGRKWAEVFCFMNPAINKDMMVGWFCNAIMTGYDIAENKYRKEGDEDETV